MEAKTVSETLRIHSTLTWLITKNTLLHSVTMKASNFMSEAIEIHVAFLESNKWLQ